MLEKIKKLDIKSIVILILSLLLVISFTIFIFKRSDYVKTIKDIKNENKELQEKRMSNNKTISKLNNDIKIDSLAIINLKQQINDVNIQLQTNELKTKSDELILSKLKNNNRNINTQISNFEKNYKMKTGERLLSSLKEKTSKK